MLKYLETFYKSRYLVSEIAIATGRRVVTPEHWKFCANKLIERNLAYQDAAENIMWLLTPTKVTAHRDLLSNYLPAGRFNSWAINLLTALDESPHSPRMYFNPSILSGLNDFFACDSHWTAQAAKKYVEPIIEAIGVDPSILKLRQEKILHQGNCNFGSNDGFAKEASVQYEAMSFTELFATRTYAVPDFSVKYGVNPHAELGRALIIHSSSYAYARGVFRSMFSSLVEVFSPYVSAEVIKEGKFDYVIVISAERNCAVVYDGGKFGERILNSLATPYIQETARSLIAYASDVTGDELDTAFINALGRSWLGDTGEI